MINVSYLCDGMACEGDCSCRNDTPEPCSHTTNISHAKNFKQLGVTSDGNEVYAEIDREEKDTTKSIVVINCLRPMKHDEYEAAYEEFKQQVDHGVILLNTGFELAKIVNSDECSVDIVDKSKHKIDPEDFAIRMQEIANVFNGKQDLVRKEQLILVLKLLNSLGYKTGASMFYNTMYKYIIY